MTMEMQISTPTPMNIACRTPFLARFTFFAPRFCPTKVVAAWPMLWAGRIANWSIFEWQLQPAMITEEPRPLTYACTRALENAVSPCWTPAGSPIRKISPRQVLLICKSLKTSLWAPSVLVSVMQARNAETVSAITVAIATPLIPQWNTATKRISRTIFKQLLMIRNRSGRLVSPTALKIALPIL